MIQDLSEAVELHSASNNTFLSPSSLISITGLRLRLAGSRNFLRGSLPAERCNRHNMAIFCQKLGSICRLVSTFTGFAAVGIAVSSVPLSSFGETLGLGEAVHRALTSNLELKAAYAEIDMARGRLIQAGKWPNPELEFDGTSDRAFNNEGERNLGMSVTQAFPVTSRLRIAKNIGRVDVAQAIYEIRDRERQLIAEVQNAYLEVVSSLEQIAAIEESITLNSGLVDVTTRRFEKAEVSKQEVNLAKIQVEGLRQDLRERSAEHDSSLLVLKTRLGMKPDEALEVTGSLDSLLTDLGKTQNASSSTVVYRPDVRRMELEVDKARSERNLAKAKAWEDIRVGIGFESERAVDEPAGLTRDEFFGLKVSIPLPLFNGNEGAILEKEGGIRRASGELDAKRLAVASEIRDATVRSENYAKIIAAFEKETLPLIQDNVRLLQESYAQGASDITEVIQAQAQEFGIRQRYLEALANRLKAEIDGQAARGSNPMLKKETVTLRLETPNKGRRNIDTSKP